MPKEDVCRCGHKKSDHCYCGKHCLHQGEPMERDPETDNRIRSMAKAAKTRQARKAILDLLKAPLGFKLDCSCNGYHRLA